MKRNLILLLVLTLLASCATPRYGVYYTPTPDITILPLVNLVTPTLLPTFTPDGFIPSETPSPTNPAIAFTLTPFMTNTPITVGTNGEKPPIFYETQGGDTMPAVAAHFGVDESEIKSSAELVSGPLLMPGTLLFIPDVLNGTGPAENSIPDSEIVFSPAAVGFSSSDYIEETHGYLSRYRQYLGSTGWISGADAVQRSALENSFNPRLILALIDYESNWVSGEPKNLVDNDYPLNYPDSQYRGLYPQLTWAVRELSNGYYGWRIGQMNEITFVDGTKLRLAPNLNAGTAAIQYYFAQTRTYDEWIQIIDPRVGFPAFYAEMFGDPWERAKLIEPIISPGLTQPVFEFPFVPNIQWTFTGGPHAAWEKGGALAALDFAPPLDRTGCGASIDWVLAMAPGLIVRANNGAVVLDLDGDGSEQTGWNILYMHIATKDRVEVGQYVQKDDKIGHPSCEGGVSTGAHVHIARKYNGEWVLAGGPIPFTMSGWVTQNGEAPYQGSLTNGTVTIEACTCGSQTSAVIRPRVP